MNLDIVKVDNGIYNVCVIKDDEYIGRSIIHGQEWDRWMRRDPITHSVIRNFVKRSRMFWTSERVTLNM